MFHSTVINRVSGRTGFLHTLTVLFLLLAFMPTTVLGGTLLDTLRPSEQKNFTDLLRYLKMVELIEQVGKDLGKGNTPEASEMKADGISDPDQADERTRLYDLALKLLRERREKAAKTLEKGPADESIKALVADYKLAIDYFEDLMKIVEIQVLKKGGGTLELLERRYHLKEDNVYEIATRLTEDVLNSVEKGEKELAARIAATRKRIILNRYKSAQQRLAFWGGVARYVRAMGLGGKEAQAEARKKLLRTASVNFQTLVANPNFVGKAAAGYWLAKVYCEQERYTFAQPLLQKAMEEPAMATEASLWAARNYAMWGISMQKKNLEGASEKFALALKMLEKFRSGKPANKGVAYWHDVAALILECSMYKGWSDALKANGNEAAAKEKLSKCQPALEAFKTTHSSVDERIYTLLENFGITPANSGLRLAKRKIDRMDELERKEGDMTSAEAEEFSKLELEAKELLEQVNKDDEKYPEVLFELGRIEFLKRQNIESAKMFYKMATEFPDYPKSKTAADYAMRLMKEHLARHKGKIPITYTKLFEQCLWAYLSKWGKDDPEWKKKEIDMFWMVESDQCDLIATYHTDMSPDKEVALKFRERSVEALRYVPKESKYYIRAKYRILVGRAETMMLTPESIDKTKAAELAAELEEFAKTAQSKWKKKDTAAANIEIGDKGSRAAFCACRLKFVSAGETDSTAKKLALAAVDGMWETWPGTDVLGECKRWQIVRLLDVGDISKASAEFKIYKKKYGKDADGVMQEIVDKLLGEIRRLEEINNPSEMEKRKLAQYRQSLREFAGNIFAEQGVKAGIEGLVKKYDEVIEKSVSDGVPAIKAMEAAAADEEKVHVFSLLIYGRALVTSGGKHAVTARDQLLPLLELLKASYVKAHKADMELLIASRINSIKGADNNLASLSTLVKGFVEFLVSSRYLDATEEEIEKFDLQLLSEELAELRKENDPDKRSIAVDDKLADHLLTKVKEQCFWDSSMLTTLYDAVLKATEASEKERSDACKHAATILSKTYEAIKPNMMNDMPVSNSYVYSLDAMLLEASVSRKCASNTAEHKNAMKLLLELSQRLDRETTPVKYWDVMVMYFEAAKDGFAKDDKVKRNVKSQVTVILADEKVILTPSQRSSLQRILQWAKSS